MINDKDTKETRGKWMNKLSLYKKLNKASLSFDNWKNSSVNRYLCRQSLLGSHVTLTWILLQMSPGSLPTRRLQLHWLQCCRLVSHRDLQSILHTGHWGQKNIPKDILKNKTAHLVVRLLSLYTILHWENLGSLEKRLISGLVRNI